MSIVDRDGGKVLAPRDKGAERQLTLEELYGDAPELTWKRLAMLSLRDAGWTLAQIGRVFGHHKGHVLRSLAAMESDIRNRLEEG